jgi:hypothetical protein
MAQGCSLRKVKYEQVYPGIDVVYYGTGEGQLEYDFNVAAGADESNRDDLQAQTN